MESGGFDDTNMCENKAHLFSSLSASSKPDMSDSATVLEAFKFIESAAAEFSDEDEEEDSEGRDKTILDLAAVRL